jgi:hypothetical protein
MKCNPKLSALFRISDAVAWLVFVSALALPLVEFAPQTGVGGPARLPLSLTVLCVVVAFGAFLLTRRRLFGLLLVLFLPVAFDFFTNWVASTLYVLSALIVFGSPFMLAFVEARQNARHVAS